MDCILGSIYKIILSPKIKIKFTGQLGTSYITNLQSEQNKSFLPSYVLRTTTRKAKNVQLVRVISNRKCLVCLPVKLQMVSVKCRTNFCSFFPIYSLRFHQSLQNRHAYIHKTKWFLCSTTGIIKMIFLPPTWSCYPPHPQGPPIDSHLSQ